MMKDIFYFVAVLTMIPIGFVAWGLLVHVIRTEMQSVKYEEREW